MTAIPETAGEKIAEKINLDRKRVEESLVSTAVGIINDMELLLKHLEDDTHINSLGELQARGSELDRLCGMREQIVELQNVANYVNEKDAS